MARNFNRRDEEPGTLNPFLNMLPQPTPDLPEKQGTPAVNQPMFPGIQEMLNPRQRRRV